MAIYCAARGGSQVHTGVKVSNAKYYINLAPVLLILIVANHPLIISQFQTITVLHFQGGVMTSVTKWEELFIPTLMSLSTMKVDLESHRKKTFYINS